MPTILNQTIDTVYVSLCGNFLPSATFLQRLPAWDAHLATPPGFGKPATFPIQIPGAGGFNLLPFSHHPFRYILSNPEIADIRIWQPAGWDGESAKGTGQIFIEFRSIWLQSQGYQAVRAFCEAVLQFFAEFEDYQILVRRADIAIDVAGAELAIDDVPHFVSRARRIEAVSREQWIPRAMELLGLCPSPAGGGVPVNPFASPQADNRGVGMASGGGEVTFSQEQYRVLQLAFESLLPGFQDDRIICKGRNLETLYFGSFSSPLYARLYCKSREIKVSGKSWLLPIWHDAGWDGEGDVWRVEFSLSSKFLHHAWACISDDGEVEMDLRDWDKFCSCLPQIWQYLTGSWLRHTDGSLSRTRQNCDSHFWRCVRSAWESEFPLVRAKLEREISIDRLQAQFQGIFKSLAAICAANAPDIRAILRPVLDLIDSVKNSNWLDELADRRIALGLDPLSCHWFEGRSSSDRATLEDMLSLDLQATPEHIAAFALHLDDDFDWSLFTTLLRKKRYASGLSS